MTYCFTTEQVRRQFVPERHKLLLSLRSGMEIAMTDKELLYIKTIVEEKSLNKAAQKLFLSQPALSHTVQQIEAVLGVPLFDRTPHGLIPTRAGEKYYQLAIDILRRYNRFISELSMPQQSSGSFLFATTTSLADSIFCSIYPAFLNKHPDIRATIHEGPHYQMLSALKDGSVDMLILYSALDAKLTDFQYQLIQKDSIVVIANPKMLTFQSARFNAAYKYPVIDPSELCRYPYIKNASINPTSQLIDAALESNGIHLNSNIYLQIGRTYTVAQLAFSTAGFGFAPSLQTNILPENCKYMLPEGFFPSYDLYAIMPANCAPNPAENIFINYVKDSLKGVTYNSAKAEL